MAAMETEISEIQLAPNEDYSYEIVNGEVHIKRCLSEETNIVVPNMIEGYPVTVLKGFSGIYSGTQIETITLPKYAADILPNDFACGNNVIDIFTTDDCENYKSIDGVLYSADGTVLVMFPRGRSGSFTVPDGVKEIGSSAFLYCDLSELTLCNGIESIGDHAFKGSDIDKLYIPDSIRNVGTDIFLYNSNPSISAPLNVACTYQLSKYSGTEFRGESTLNRALRTKLDLMHFSYYSSETEADKKMYADLNFDGFPELIVIEQNAVDCIFRYNSDEKVWQCEMRPSYGKTMDLYYDSESDTYFYCFITTENICDAIYSFEAGGSFNYNYEIIFDGWEVVSTYEENELWLTGWKKNFLELIHIKQIDFEHIISEFAPEDTSLNYEIVLNGISDEIRLPSDIFSYTDAQKIIENYTNSTEITSPVFWRNEEITSFPYVRTAYPDTMAVIVDGKNLIEGEMVDGVTFSSGTLTLDNVCINSEDGIKVMGVEHGTLILKGNNVINSGKKISLQWLDDLTVSGDGTLDAGEIIIGGSVKISENVKLTASIIRANKNEGGNFTITDNAEVKKSDTAQTLRIHTDLFNMKGNSSCTADYIYCDEISMSGNSQAFAHHVGEHMDSIKLLEESSLIIEADKERHEGYGENRGIEYSTSQKVTQY